MSLSSLEGLGSESDSDSSFSNADSGYDAADEKFIQLDNIVQCLFNTRLLNDIECRKILVEAPNVLTIRAAIYEIMFTKDEKTFKQILQIFRNHVDPLQNPRILQRIFSYLKYADVSKCKNVYPDWKQIINLVVGSKYDEVNLEHRLLKNLVSKNEKIQNTKSRYLKIEKRAAAFQLMLATNPENDQNMLETLQIGKDIPPDVNNISINISFAAENNTGHLIAKVLSNHTVLSNIFQFLTLTDIKNCRTVCHSWNSVSEPHLKKLSAIKLYSKFTPTNFLNVSKSYLPLPNLPCKAFKFREVFSTEEVSEFFTKYGENIRSLDLCLLKNLRTYLSHTVCNLTELSFSGVRLKNSDCRPNYDPQTTIPWSALYSIKNLYLTDTFIDIDKDQDGKRITPVKLHLDKVHFFVGGGYPAEITLNDYIEFTKIVHLNVSGGVRQIQQLDLARDTFDAEKVRFSNIRLINAGKSKSAVKYLKLDCRIRYSEKYCISVKQLMVEIGGATNVHAFPPSIEKLVLYTLHRDDFFRESRIDLPNLKYLCYRSGHNLLSVFEICPNLTDIEITGTNIVDFVRLPRSIKKLKMESSSRGLNIIVRGLRDEHLDLDLLILDNVLEFGLTNLFDEIHPKVLVLQIGGVHDKNKDDDFISFVKKNKKMDKIYVQFHPSRQPSVFCQSQISKIVDKQSEFYEFSNESGKAITSTEFVTIQKSLAMQTAMKEFFDTQEEQQAKKHREDFYKRFQSYAAQQDTDYRFRR